MTRTGEVFGIAKMFIFGNWIAIVIALVFLSLYSRWITKELNDMGDALLATQMALSREQKLTVTRRNSYRVTSEIEIAAS